MKTLLGIKQEMFQTFLADGTRIPVTKIKAGPCVVTQVKTKQKDGYNAVQLGVGQKKAKSSTKPLTGHLKKVLEKTKEVGKDFIPLYISEAREEKEVSLKVGDIITANQILKKGDVVNITGTSKGKGFTGVMKRWGFKGGPRTHGQSDRQRAPGSIGQATTPGRVFKGKKMAGRSGSYKVTVQNLLVVKVTPEGELWIKGLVPGTRSGLLKIKKVSETEFQGLFDEVNKKNKKPTHTKLERKKK